MRVISFFLLLIPHFLIAHFDEVFSDDEDPAHFQHVNVITGHLNLTFQDANILGARPIPISRTYSSSGALEYSYRSFSKWNERTFYLADRVILGGTYRGVLDRSILINNQKYGYYNAENR